MWLIQLKLGGGADKGTSTSKTGNSFTCTLHVHLEVFNRVSMHDIILLQKSTGHLCDWSCATLSFHLSMPHACTHISSCCLAAGFLDWKLLLSWCSGFFVCLTVYVWSRLHAAYNTHNAAVRLNDIFSVKHRFIDCVSIAIHIDIELPPSPISVSFGQWIVIPSPLPCGGCLWVFLLISHVVVGQYTGSFCFSGHSKLFVQYLPLLSASKWFVFLP